jgi:hypothetical protein
MSVKKFSKRLSDEEIVSLLLAIDGDLTHIEISEQLPTSEFLLTSKEGASFQGVLIGHDDKTVRLRQADGQIIAVLKSAVAAVRRPIAK